MLKQVTGLFAHKVEGNLPDGRNMLLANGECSGLRSMAGAEHSQRMPSSVFGVDGVVKLDLMPVSGLEFLSRMNLTSMLGLVMPVLLHFRLVLAELVAVVSKFLRVLLLGLLHLLKGFLVVKADTFGTVVMLTVLDPGASTDLVPFLGVRWLDGCGGHGHGDNNLVLANMVFDVSVQDTILADGDLLGLVADLESHFAVLVRNVLLVFFDGARLGSLLVRLEGLVEDDNGVLSIVGGERFSINEVGLLIAQTSHVASSAAVSALALVVA